jgi:SMC interacting uncharacterized protein involved in chromosome segregation
MRPLLTDEKMHRFYNETMEQNSLNHPKDFGEKIRNLYEEKLSEKNKEFQGLIEEKIDWVRQMNNRLEHINELKYKAETLEKQLSEIKKITRCDRTDDFKEKEKFYKNLVKINAEHFKVMPSLEEQLSEKDKEINDLVHRANKAEAWNDKYKTQLSELREENKRKDELLEEAFEAGAKYESGRYAYKVNIYQTFEEWKEQALNPKKQ